MTSSTASSTVVLRHATAADDRSLRDLAALDSARLGPGPHLVAEVRGHVVAALSLSDGSTIADPFERTAELVDLLRTHASARAAAQRRSRVTARRRPRRALGV